MKFIIFASMTLYFLSCGGLQAAAKRDLQFENESVKVWKTTILPQDNLKMHRHDHDRIVIGLKGGKLIKIEASGEKSDLIFETHKAYWLEKDPAGKLHGDFNPSNQSIEVMVIEFK